MAPFAEVVKEYGESNPDTEIITESHGSIQVIRQVTDINREIDIIAVADYALIPQIMYGTQMPESNWPYADWCIRFATNRLVLAYSDTSKYVGEMNNSTWYKILARPDVKVGLADPRIDALGYRAMMLAQLSEEYYKDETIFESLFTNAFSKPIDVIESNGVDVIHVPELLEPADSRIVFRGSSVQTIALVQSGDIDYTFEYLSVVKQQGLKYVELPPEIDMGSEDLAELYAGVRVKLDFQRFKSVSPVFGGQPIIYGLTIPRNAPNRDEAIKFFTYLLGKDGTRIFDENYHPMLSEPTADYRNNLPEELKSLFE